MIAWVSRESFFVFPRPRTFLVSRWFRAEGKEARRRGWFRRKRRVGLARIVIFLNPQEKAYCNNPRGSDSKPAVHSMYLSYPPPANPALHFQPSCGILHHRLPFHLSYTLLTRYKSRVPLNRTSVVRGRPRRGIRKECASGARDFSDSAIRRKVESRGWIAFCIVERSCRFRKDLRK